MDDKTKQIHIHEVKDIIEEETRSQFLQKSAINKYLLKDQPIGLEKNSAYLGVNPEQIVYSYTFDQLNETSTYEKIAQAMKNREVKKAIIHSDLAIEGITRIIKEAEVYHIPFTIVKDPAFKGDVGLELIR
ncbi:DUF1694 domain-containing protein [Tepidibacillus fermentans]|uniref:Uncharacterized protein YueI n=1 Tax=Tepidibacillus fermentans TaxID=1281767 RepID=A0A4R3KEH1_9BACI|nr:DUF1694 domain-containing protein [Tepidibacillus fermentans]TCS81510.1 uncharacterized protein YueI [Tepidibacillus fermentans]